MLDILQTILIVGGGVLVIIFFLFLFYVILLYFKIAKINKSVQDIVWNFKITKLGINKTFNFLNRILKKNGNK